MKSIDLIKSGLEIGLYKLKDKIHGSNTSVSTHAKSIVKQIKEHGLVEIPSFFSLEEIASLRRELDRVLTDYKDRLWVDPEGADNRALGINNVSATINKLFYYNELIQAVRYEYYQLTDEHIIGHTLGARISAAKNNKGSGGGWHRDSVNVRQLKAICYLTDVAEKNGPFQYLLGTQNKYSVIEGILKHNFKHNHNRFTDSEIETILTDSKYTVKTCTGKAGNLLLVDTSGVHRGMPLKEGVREALTNYYWVAKEKGGTGVPAIFDDLIIS